MDFDKEDLKLETIEDLLDLYFEARVRYEESIGRADEDERSSVLWDIKEEIISRCKEE